MNGAASEYLRHLPRVLSDTGTGFIGDYLKIFEALLSGRADARLALEPEAPAGAGPRTLAVPSLEGIIEGFRDLLDPALTAAEPAGQGSAFLDYLASWVGLSFDQNWELDKRREWLRRVVPLYKRRGTKAGLAEYLSMFLGRQVRIDEGGFTVGVRANSTVGVSSFIAHAHFFRVLMNYGFPPDRFDLDEWKQVRRGTRAIVDLEKPAHTHYALSARTPGFIVGSRSTVGHDTLIWQQSRPLPMT